jgi:hypothetical protein
MANLEGYKPRFIRTALGVGEQTLRYWRLHLDPQPKRVFFSSSDVLAFRIIKELIYDRGLSVKDLSVFPTDEIFYYCQEEPPELLSLFSLVLDKNDCSINWLYKADNKSVIRRGIHAVDLSLVVEEHLNALSSQGEKRNHNKKLKSLRKIVMSYS